MAVDQSNNRRPSSFLRTMKLRKNSKNKSSTSVITTSDTTEATLPNGRQVKVELASRRVIKATPPPESKPKESRGDSHNSSSSLTGLGLEASTEVTATELDSSSSTNGYDHGHGHGHGGSGYTTNVPFVQNEALREKTEQWRQERIRQDGVRRKENKAKDTMEHRLSGRISPSSPLQSSRDGVEDGVKMELPAALSVASQFPEHKRKSRSKNIEDAKKLKIDEDTESESASASTSTAATPLHKNTVSSSSSSSGGKKGESEGFKSKAMSAIKSSAPAIVVAVAAILAVRLLSGRR